MSNLEELSNKIQDLQNENLRTTTLQEIKQTISSIPQEEMCLLASTFQLPLVFDCLNNSDEQQVDLACDVLSLCMSNLNLGESTTRYGVFLERALNHPFTSVKLMALNEIKRNIDVESVLHNLCMQESYLLSLIRCIGDNDVSVATVASNILLIIGRQFSGVQLLCNDKIQSEFFNIMQKNEIVRLRIYELFINIALISEENFNIINSTTPFSQILNEINNNDVLFKLNVLELLSLLGTVKYGFEYLERNNVLWQLSKCFDQEDSVNLYLSEPGILKFFGSMAQWNCIEIIEKYPKLFQRMIDNLQSSDFIIVGVSLDTIGFIAKSSKGIEALQSKGIIIDDVIKFISKSLVSYPTEIKIRALQCFENIFSNVDKNYSEITLKWFQLIDDNPMEYFWKYMKNPFPEISLASYGIVNMIVRQNWGPHIIKNTPGLVEFFLDRNKIMSKEVKEANFAIVKALGDVPIFDETLNKHIREFIKEGPFYVRGITEVVVEI